MNFQASLNTAVIDPSIPVPAPTPRAFQMLVAPLMVENKKNPPTPSRTTVTRIPIVSGSVLIPP